MSELFDFKHCPACGKPGLEKTFKPNGQEAFFCAEGCQWIGGRKEAEDLLALKTQVRELEEHIKELGEKALDGMMLVQKSKLSSENIPEKQRSLDPTLTKDPAHKMINDLFRLQQDLLLAAIKYNALAMHMGRRCVAIRFCEGRNHYEIQLVERWPYNQVRGCIDPRRDLEEFTKRELRAEEARFRQYAGVQPIMDDETLTFDREIEKLARRYLEHEQAIWKMMPRLEDVEAYTIHCPEDFNKRVFGNFKPDRPSKDGTDNQQPED